MFALSAAERGKPKCLPYADVLKWEHLPFPKSLPFAGRKSSSAPLPSQGRALSLHRASACAALPRLPWVCVGVNRIGMTGLVIGYGNG